jgi:hypothetical protein
MPLGRTPWRRAVSTGTTCSDVCPWVVNTAAIMANIARISLFIELYNVIDFRYFKWA